MNSKYFLLFCGLSFQSPNSILWCTKVLNFNEVKFIFPFVAILMLYMRKLCQTQNHEYLHLCLLSIFIVLVLKSRYLIHFTIKFYLWFKDPGSLFAHVQFFSHFQLFAIPPGSSVHGNFQARSLDWVAISYSNCYAWEYTIFQAPFIRENFLLHCMILKPLRKSLGHWSEDFWAQSHSIGLYVCPKASTTLIPVLL